MEIAGHSVEDTAGPFRLTVAPGLPMWNPVLDSIAAVQARIDAIQSRFGASRVAPTKTAAPSPATATPAAGDDSFEAQLAAALGEEGGSADPTSLGLPAGVASQLGVAGGIAGSPAPVRTLPSAGGRPTVEGLVSQALAQTGDTYRFGASTSVSDPNPTAFDCSELVRWAAGRNGVELPDGSWNQYLAAKQAGLELTVDQALHTRGALLYRFESDPAAGGRPAGAHVAISLGDGRTIEARGRKWGVGSWDATGRFTHASLVPGFSY